MRSIYMVVKMIDDVVVIKLAVWMSGIYTEEKYVESESRKPHGPYLADAYADVDEEEEEYGDRTDYR